MAVYAIIAPRDPQRLEAGLQKLGVKSYKLSPDSWMVAYEGTSDDLSKALGIAEGVVPSGVVLSIGNYTGRASADLWEWLKLNWAPKSAAS